MSAPAIKLSGFDEMNTTALISLFGSINSQCSFYQDHSGGLLQLHLSLRGHQNTETDEYFLKIVFESYVIHEGGNVIELTIAKFSTSYATS